MLNARQILVSASLRQLAKVFALAALAALSACGQKGALYLPTEPAAAQRATLPQVLTGSGSKTAPAPAEASSAPASSSVPSVPASRP
ncbi:LPS translocon maturation chaperone LptM [Pseudacidovorax intermedius]|uniref:LPS translocon maturation chaperone LptM n=1 Tax=Pseudacidovorax intermedius TaxID=433924 RepID=UPI0009DB8260|nr:lipoprotein [Pseudacidovorax intermedius]